MISGNGSNLQAIIDWVEAGKINANIACVISNRPDAYGLERARNAGIEAICLDHKQYEDRETYDQALLTTLDSYQPDCVVLAGFMRILTSEFVEHFSGRLLNIHPSLLPKYKGLNTHQRALDNGDDEHGLSLTAGLSSFNVKSRCLKMITPMPSPNGCRSRNVVFTR